MTSLRPSRALITLAVIAGVPALSAQTPNQATETSPKTAQTADATATPSNVKIWGSISFLEGGIRAPEYRRNRASGGTAALWATYRHLAVSLRSMGIPAHTDGTTGVGDWAILGGAHFPVGRRADFVAGIGTGQSSSAGFLASENYERTFAAAAQLDLNYRFVAIGLDAMAGVGKTRRYAGAGFSFSLGWFGR